MSEITQADAPHKVSLPKSCTRCIPHFPALGMRLIEEKKFQTRIWGRVQYSEDRTFLLQDSSCTCPFSVSEIVWKCLYAEVSLSLRCIKLHSFLPSAVNVTKLPKNSREWLNVSLDTVLKETTFVSSHAVYCCSLWLTVTRTVQNVFEYLNIIEHTLSVFYLILPRSFL
jgi:hypothetical protein